MGCFGSKEAAVDPEGNTTELASGGGLAPVPRSRREKVVKHFNKPKWKADPPITLAQLQKQREEFWDTQPHYGGDRIIWDTLKAACEADIETARLIIETAGIVVTAADLTTCYDERGSKYELPKYVLSVPTNLAPVTD